MNNEQNNRYGNTNQDGKTAEENIIRNTKTDSTRKSPDGLLPEDDPAVINPNERATFPPEAKTSDPDMEGERDNHMVNRKTSPARDGKKITRTDTASENDRGFI